MTIVVVEEELGPPDEEEDEGEIDMSCALVPSALCVNFARVLKTLVEPCP